MQKVKNLIMDSAGDWIRIKIIKEFITQAALADFQISI